MKYIDDKVLKLDLGEIESNKVKNIACDLAQMYLNTGKGYTDKNAEEVFDNHLVSLANRIINKSLLEGEEVDTSQIAKESFKLSNELISRILENYPQPISELELMLVAIHIEFNKGGSK